MSEELLDLDLEVAIDEKEIPDELKKALCKTWDPFREVLDELVKLYVKGKYAKIILSGAIIIIDALAVKWCKSA